MVASAVWGGVLSFGLVSVPVQLYTAVERHTIRFHQVQRDTGDRVRQKRVNERTGHEVPFDDVKGYPTDDGRVIVDPKELDDLAPGGFVHALHPGTAVGQRAAESVTRAGVAGSTLRIPVTLTHGPHRPPCRPS